ncbi:hypothetical protein JCM10207_007224 [Rhodosporidiobolus poonsookiae]
MLVRLTPLDTSNGFLQLCTCYVFGLPPLSSDEDRELQRTAILEQVRGAADRVVKKWPLLAGKVVWLEKENLCAVDVPAADTFPEKPYAFTNALKAEPFNADVQPLSSTSSSHFQPTPNIANFQDPSVPLFLSDYISSGHEILSLHLTFFTNAVALGVTVHHGVLDGTGLGVLINALDAELHGKEWTAPAMAAQNPLTAAWEALPPSVKGEEPPAHSYLRQSLPAAYTPAHLRKFLARVRWERWWWQSDDRSLFIGNDAVDRLVRSVQAEVKASSGGRESVSAGDVITAWILKAAHSRDSTWWSSCSPFAVYSPRTALSPSLALYPHNAWLPYPIFPAPLPLATLASLPLSEIALLNRRTLQPFRTRAGLAATKQDVLDQPLPPFREWPAPWPLNRLLPNGGGVTHRWMLSNHTGFPLGSLSFPSTAADSEEKRDLPLLSFHGLIQFPNQPDSLMWFQRNQQGLFVNGNMRRSRWEALEAAAKELDKA